MTINSSRKRILLYAFDGGSGIGHLRMVSSLVKSLQESFACMVITGHRDVTKWFIPDETEFVRIPAWDALLHERSAYWGKTPFLDLSLAEAVQLRKTIIEGIIDAYKPDLMIVEHLPLGANGELADIISRLTCPIYLLTRGILNVSRNLADLVLGEKARAFLERFYSRIIVACDIRVADFSTTYGIPDVLAKKTIHVGYVTDAISRNMIESAREMRGAGGGKLWIAVSAGGGQLGENLIQTCIRLAIDHPDQLFDIVIGPRSRLTVNDISHANIRIHKDTPDMPLLNAGANIVVCSGGYNSLLETLQGDARVLCVANWPDPRDEQTRHPLLLRKFADVQVVSPVTSLARHLDEAIRSAQEKAPEDRRTILNLDGGPKIRMLVEQDLVPRVESQ